MPLAVRILEIIKDRGVNLDPSIRGLKHKRKAVSFAILRSIFYCFDK